jgi:hypothetical protein
LRRISPPGHHHLRKSSKSKPARFGGELCARPLLVEFIENAADAAQRFRKRL